MRKRELTALILLVVIISFSFASGASVSTTALSSTIERGTIAGASNLYSYEVSYDYTGTISGAVFYNFLGAGTANGYKEKSGSVSIYESRQDAGKTGITGAGNLFNVTYSGTLTLDYAIFVYADGTSETAYYNLPSTTTTTTTTTGGTSGGGDVAKAKVKTEDIKVDTKNLIIDLITDSSKERIIKITNTGSNEKEITIAHEGLDGLAAFSKTSFRLAPGSSEDLRVVFTAKETGIYTGKIHISGQEVLVSLNTRSKLLLFDASIIVPDESKRIEIGNKLNTQVTLIPMGDKPRVDVTINYVVKDFNGKTYLTESETILVDKQTSFKKQFQTGSLPTGNYVIGIELVYPNGVATSSSQFQVTEKIPAKLQLFLIAVIIGIIILVFAVIILVIRFKRFSSSLKRRKLAVRR